MTGETVGALGNEGAGADDGPAGLRLDGDGRGDVVGLTLIGSVVGSNVSGHSSFDLLDFDDFDDGDFEYFEDPLPPFPFPVEDDGPDLLPFPPFPLEGALLFDEPFPLPPLPLDGRFVLEEPFPDPLPLFEEFRDVDFEDVVGPAVVVTSVVAANGF